MKAIFRNIWSRNTLHTHAHSRVPLRRMRTHFCSKQYHIVGTTSNVDNTLLGVLVEFCERLNHCLVSLRLRARARSMGIIWWWNHLIFANNIFMWAACVCACGCVESMSHKCSTNSPWRRLLQLKTNNFYRFIFILRNCDIGPGHLSTVQSLLTWEAPLTKPVINFYKRHNLTQHFLIIDTVQKQTFTFRADRPVVWWCMRLWYVKTPLMCAVSTHELLQSTLVAPGDFDWAPSAGNTCAQVAASPARSPVIFEANWRVIIS